MHTRSRQILHFLYMLMLYYFLLFKFFHSFFATEGNSLPPYEAPEYPKFLSIEVSRSTQSTRESTTTNSPRTVVIK